MRKDLHEQNRRSWNAATRAHNSHKRDQAAFLRGGGSTLFEEERELLGALSGRTLLHLCCNAGQDTLSLARLGATVTGVDISDEAIAFAEKLSEESGIAAAFERADALDWLPKAARERRTFDRVFLSYGVLGWLSDLGALMRGVGGVLAHGGRLVLVEYHPFALMFDEAGERLKYPYTSGGEPHPFAAGVQDYVALGGGVSQAPSGWLDGETEFVNPHASHEFFWSLSEVLQAVLDAGLRLETVREWTWSNAWKPFANMRALDGRRFAMPEGTPQLPLMFGLVAVRR